jgi:hypothetical protein
MWSPGLDYQASGGKAAVELAALAIRAEAMPRSILRLDKDGSVREY